MSWQESEWDRSYTGVWCRSGAGGGGRIMGAEAGVHHKLAEITSHSRPKHPLNPHFHPRP